MNKDNDLLTDSEKELKNKFQNRVFQTTIIEYWKQTFEDMPMTDYKNATGEPELPDTNRLQRILFLPDEKLEEKEIEFKNVYLSRLKPIYIQIYKDQQGLEPKESEIPEHKQLFSLLYNKNEASKKFCDLYEKFSESLKWKNFKQPKMSEEIQEVKDMNNK